MKTRQETDEEYRASLLKRHPHCLADRETAAGWDLDMIGRDVGVYRQTLQVDPPREQDDAPVTSAEVCAATIKMVSETLSCELPKGHGGEWHRDTNICWSVDRTAGVRGSKPVDDPSQVRVGDVRRWEPGEVFRVIEFANMGAPEGDCHVACVTPDGAPTKYRWLSTVGRRSTLLRRAGAPMCDYLPTGLVGFGACLKAKGHDGPHEDARGGTSVVVAERQIGTAMHSAKKGEPVSVRIGADVPTIASREDAERLYGNGSGIAERAAAIVDQFDPRHLRGSDLDAYAERYFTLYRTPMHALAAAFRIIGDAMNTERGRRELVRQVVEEVVRRCPPELDARAFRCATLAVVEWVVHPSRANGYDVVHVGCALFGLDIAIATGDSTRDAWLVGLKAYCRALARHRPPEGPWMGRRGRR